MNSTDTNDTDTSSTPIETLYRFADEHFIIKPKEENEIIEWGCLTLLVLYIAFYFYYTLYIPHPMRILNYLAINHLSYCYSHLICISIYNLFKSKDNDGINETLHDILYLVYSTLDLLITFSTACISLCVALRIYTPELADIYTKKDMALFATISLTVMELYEFLFSYIYSGFTKSEILQSSLRLTIVLLLMSVTVLTLSAILSTIFIKCRIKKLQCLFFAIHLSVYVLSDLLFVLYNFYTKSYLGIPFAVILVVRPVIEMIWFVISNTFFNEYLFVKLDESVSQPNQENDSSEEDDD